MGFGAKTKFNTAYGYLIRPPFLVFAYVHVTWLNILALPCGAGAKEIAKRILVKYTYMDEQLSPK